MFSVVRIIKGERSVVMGGVLTAEAFAVQMADAFKSRDAKPGVQYVVRGHYTDPAPSGPRRSNGKRKNGPRGGRTLSQAQRREQFKRPLHELPEVWGLDDRDGDISRVTRTGEEIGLGIPAQWGKGRRHRKGKYIS